MSRNRQEKVPRVEISDGIILDWRGLEAELEQSLKACMLALDLLRQITSSLQVSVQCLREQPSHTMGEFE